MNWRLASRLSVITLAILVVVFVTVWQHNMSNTPDIGTAANGNSNNSGLQGTDLGNTPSSNFQLTDQNGKQVSLTQFKGQPVVLTFLYTHCPDECPLTAEKLHTVVQSLGSDAQKVGILAVSTDPKNDTAAAAQTFSKAHNMQDYWHFLIGSQQQLSPVWKAYNIYAEAQQQTVNHTLALYLIDKQGRERIFFGNDFLPSQMTSDLQKLLKE